MHQSIAMEKLYSLGGCVPPRGSLPFNKIKFLKIKTVRTGGGRDM